MEINTVSVSGYLTRKPETRQTNGGTPVASFTIAHNSGYGRNEKASFYSCRVYGPQATWAEKYLDKGSHVIIQNARLSQRSWEGKDGVRRSTITLEGGDIGFYSVRRRNQNASSPAPAQSAPQQTSYQPVQDPDGFMDIGNMTEDLPFT